MQNTKENNTFFESGRQAQPPLVLDAGGKPSTKVSAGRTCRALRLNVNNHSSNKNTEKNTAAMATTKDYTRHASWSRDAS